MQLLDKCNKGIRFSLRVIDIFSKCVWIVLLKDKKDITITDAFQNVLDESEHKSNKIWIGKDSKSYEKKFLKSWLEKNDIEMYATNNEGKYFVAERFIRTLKNKIYNYMTSISKNVYNDEFGDIIKKYSNIYCETIKM